MGSLLRLVPLDILTPRRFKLCLMLAAILFIVWLTASFAVAFRLTRRHRAPFQEPHPVVSWGAFASHRLKTRDGEEIGAWIAPGAEDAPSVLLLHGNGSGRAASLGRAELLAEQGCTVLLISLRAHGDSTGDFNDIGYSARHDVVAAVDFLERCRPGRPIVIHGTSLGAAAAVFAAGELGHRVRGYILESPYQDLRIAVRNRTENQLPPILDRIAYLGLRSASWIILPDLPKISPFEAIRAIPDDVPVLIMAGGQDLNARPGEARALHDRIRSHSQLVIFDRAGHLNFAETYPEVYKDAILDFLKRVESGSG